MSPLGPSEVGGWGGGSSTQMSVTPSTQAGTGQGPGASTLPSRAQALLCYTWRPSHPHHKDEDAVGKHSTQPKFKAISCLQAGPTRICRTRDTGREPDPIPTLLSAG